MARFNIMDSILCMYPCITRATSSHEINPVTQALVTTECPFNRTAIIAVSVAPHTSGIHQKRRTPLRNTRGKARNDGLLQGFLTLNITQIAPIGTGEQISCQPGE